MTVWGVQPSGPGILTFFRSTFFQSSCRVFPEGAQLSPNRVNCTINVDVKLLGKGLDADGSVLAGTPQGGEPALMDEKVAEGLW